MSFFMQIDQDGGVSSILFFYLVEFMGVWSYGNEIILFKIWDGVFYFVCLAEF